MDSFRQDITNSIETMLHNFTEEIRDHIEVSVQSMNRRASLGNLVVPQGRHWRKISLMYADDMILIILLQNRRSRAANAAADQSNSVDRSDSSTSSTAVVGTPMMTRARRMIEGEDLPLCLAIGPWA